MINKELFNKVDKILMESMKPSEDIMRLIESREFDKEPFNQIKKLDKIEQNPKYHPEGSVLKHILLVVDEASKVKDKSKDKRAFMWGAFLHDIGKLTTTRIRKNRITSYNHDFEGEKLATEFLDKLTDDKNFILNVSKYVKWHMQPLFFDKNLPFFKPKDMLNDVEYKEIALISYCDRLGRGGMTPDIKELEKGRIKKFYEHFS
ncbi:MAG: HD domain-containing protein [Peptostreptococcaceae bacterium]